MTDRNYRETTNREEIQDWADQRGFVPAHRTGTEDIVFVRQSEAENSTDELTWEEFDDEFERQNTTFRYEDDDPTETSHYEFVEEGTAAGADRDAERLVDEDTIEEGDVLEKGESARSEVTETKTIEKEVVETATVETEVVDEEVVSEEVIDEELLDRDLSNCTIDERGEYVESDLRERKRITTETRERNLLEHEVVDADANETRTVNSDTTDRDVDIEGERDLADEDTVEHTVEETHIEGRGQTDVEVDVDDRETEHEERIERRIVETEVVENYHIRAAVESRDRFDEEVVSEEVTDTELLDDEATTADAGSEATGRGDSISDDDDGMLDDGDISDENSTRERTSDETVHVSGDQKGNDVVDADGERVGILSEVDDGVLYVDPDPSFTERLLGVGEADEGDVVVKEEHIELIEGDKVRLSREGQEDLERKAN